MDAYEQFSSLVFCIFLLSLVLENIYGTVAVGDG